MVLVAMFRGVAAASDCPPGGVEDCAVAASVAMHPALPIAGAILGWVYGLITSPAGARQDSRKMMIRVGLASLAGMVLERILPYVYASIVGTLLDVLHVQGNARDQFNTVAMTAQTFLASFALSYRSTRARKIEAAQSAGSEQAELNPEAPPPPDRIREDAPAATPPSPDFIRPTARTVSPPPAGGSPQERPPVMPARPQPPPPQATRPELRRPERRRDEPPTG